MSWFGSPSPGGVMWSIVQSPPISSLEQMAQIGSRIVLAYALALAHSLLLCHSAISYKLSLGLSFYVA
jgi:hypothetical protein